MGKKISDKQMALKEAKKSIEILLSQKEPILFMDTELYLVSKFFYKTLIDIDATLIPYKTDSRRGKAYSIDKIVNILNPQSIAFKYHLTKANKSTMISDRNKIIDRLEEERSSSEKNIMKRANDKILEESPLENEKQLILNKATQKIIDEQKEFNKIHITPERYDLLISGFKESIPYGQINFHYLEDKKIVKTNKHLSIKLPNILIFDDYLEDEGYRSDMFVAKFIKGGYKAFGRVYARLKT